MYIVNFGNLLQYKLKSKGSRSRMSRSFKKVLKNKSTFLFEEIGECFRHTRLSPRLGGRLNLGGAVWAVKLICTLLV